MKRHSLGHVVDAITKALKDSEGIGSIPATERLYQFKITLLEVTPPIWRRIQVRNCSLDKLHERIQTAMGWTNSHLNQFVINGERYGDPQLIDEPSDDYYCVDSTVTQISNILPKSGERFSLSTNTTLVIAGIMRFCLRVAFRLQKALDTPFVLKANEHVRQKTLAALGATPNIFKSLPM
jgi:hypothetical protein